MVAQILPQGRAPPKPWEYDKVDFILMGIGSLAALGNAVALPILVLLLGQMVDILGGLGNPLHDPSLLFRGSPNFNDKISSVALAFLYLGLASFLFMYLEYSLWSIASARRVTKLQQAFVSAVLHKNLHNTESLSAPGQILHTLQEDMSTIQDTFGYKAALSLHHLLSFLSGIAVAFWQGWDLALVLCACLPLLMATGMLMGCVVPKFTAVVHKAHGKANCIATEALTQIRTVAANNMRDETLSSYRGALNLAAKASRRHMVIIGLGLGTMTATLFLTMAAALGYGSFQVMAGRHTPAQVLSVLVAIMFGGASAGGALAYVQIFQRGKAAEKRILSVIETSQECNMPAGWEDRPTGTMATVAGTLTLTGVTFSYPQAPEGRVLRELHLHVAAGRTLALVGSSGCGKSTVLSLMLRLYQPCNGCVLLDGVDVHGLDLKWYRSLFGYVNQEPLLLWGTIYDNIVLGRVGITMEEVKAAAAAAGAEEFVAQLPQGYDTPVGSLGGCLSGGQKQRLCIARALLGRPKILLLDEATSSLDSVLERAVQQALDALTCGRTSVVVAHKLGTIRHADCIAVMRDGQVVQQGTHNQLMADPQGLYASMVRLQTGGFLGDLYTTGPQAAHEGEPGRDCGPPAPLVAPQSHETTPREAAANSEPIVEGLTTTLPLPMHTKVVRVPGDAGTDLWLTEEVPPAPSLPSSDPQWYESLSECSCDRSVTSIRDYPEPEREGALGLGPTGWPNSVFEGPSSRDLSCPSTAGNNALIHLDLGRGRTETRPGALVPQGAQPPAGSQEVSRKDGGSKPLSSSWKDGGSKPLSSSPCHHCQHPQCSCGDTSSSSATDFDNGCLIRCSFEIRMFRLHQRQRRARTYRRTGQIGRREIPTVEEASQRGMTLTLLKLNQPEWRWALLGSVGSLFLGLSMPVFGFVFAGLLNSLFGQESQSALIQLVITYCVVLVGMAALQPLLSSVEQMAFGEMGSRLATRVRLLLLGATLQQDPLWLDQQEGGALGLASIISSDAACLRGAVGDTLAIAIRGLVAMLAGCSLSFAFDWRMALLALGLLPLLLVGQLIFFKVEGGINQDKVDRGRAQTIFDALKNIKVIHAFSAQDFICQQYAVQLRAMQRKTISSAHRGGAAMGLSFFQSQAVYGLVTYFAGQMIVRGYSSFPDMSRALLVVLFSAAAVGMAQMAFPDLGKARSSVEKIFQLMKACANSCSAPDRVTVVTKGETQAASDCGSTWPSNDMDSAYGAVKHKSGPRAGCWGHTKVHDEGREPCEAGARVTRTNTIKGHIQFDKVTFSYPSRAGVRVLDKLSLDIPAGSTVALVGGSGGGKSTMISLLERFFDPCSGIILLDGRELRTYDLQWLRNQVGWVGQDPCLFSATVLDNIRCGRPGASEDEVVRAARLADAHGFIDQLADGYYTQLGDGAVQLSGGQKQRLAIARALLKTPRVLLLDEVTSALDPYAEQQVQETIEHVVRELSSTCVVAAHRLHTVQLADKIAVLVGGRVVEQGPHDQLMRQGAYYASLYRAYNVLQ